MGRPLLNDEGQKLCTTCGKPGTFTKAPMGHMGLAAECNACRSLYRGQPERRRVARAWSKAYRAKHPKRHRGDPVKDRARKRRYKVRTYGLTLAELEEMLVRQCRRCAICPATIADTSEGHVDHDHATGKVRGILCRQCNFGLGQFRDDPTRLRRAAAYLEHDRNGGLE